MKRKRIFTILVLVLLTCALSTTAFAIDESEVESAIAASSQEEVAGNIFIWFLCAIGFLKVSQKIDSFMASLGVNVGRTGGSMLAELMVAGRGIATAAGAFGSTVSNRHSSHGTHNGGQAAGAAFTGGGNGLVGVTKRAVGNAAASSATGTGSGLSNMIGGAMFGSSLASGGKFATSVIGAVAKGDISSVGSITGEQASEALTSYLGYVEAGKCAQIEWENSAVTGQIQVRKYSADDNLVTGQRAGSALEGAVFEITQARSGKVVGYIVTDARGVAASDPLPLGRYFVTEVSAPKYYQLSSEKMEAEIEYPNQIIKLSAYNKSANLGVTIKKTGNREVQPGQVMSYDFSGIGNTSNVALNSFFWHDRIPTDATRAISVTTGTYNARLYYKVTFKTNLSDYRTLASNLLTSNNYSLSLNAATLGLAQGEYVTDVRFEFGTVPSGFASVVKPTMRVQVLGTVSNGYQIINRADVGGQYLNEWQTAKATWVTTVCRFNNNPLPKTGY